MATTQNQQKQFARVFDERLADAKRALEGPRPRDIETYLQKVRTQVNELKELVTWSTQQGKRLRIGGRQRSISKSFIERLQCQT